MVARLAALSVAGFLLFGSTVVLVAPGAIGDCREDLWGCVCAQAKRVNYDCRNDTQSGLNITAEAVAVPGTSVSNPTSGPTGGETDGPAVVSLQTGGPGPGEGRVTFTFRWANPMGNRTPTAVRVDMEDPNPDLDWDDASSDSLEMAVSDTERVMEFNFTLTTTGNVTIPYNITTNSTMYGLQMQHYELVIVMAPPVTPPPTVTPTVPPGTGSTSTSSPGLEWALLAVALLGGVGYWRRRRLGRSTLPRRLGTAVVHGDRLAKAVQRSACTPALR